MMRPNRWLAEFASNFTSQFGEDGIIEKILEVIGDTNHWCVEFGASDGMYLSNTRNLIVNKGYSGVLIEGDRIKYEQLQKNYQKVSDILKINAFVGFEEKDGLDYLLQPLNVPIDFDLLSIDIDGNDYYIWESLQKYRPKVVVIEYNSTIDNSIEFVQPRNMRVNQGASLLSIDKLAKQKGYELVAVTKGNALFVDLKYFDLFEIVDNSVIEMRTDKSLITYLFQGYDGTIFLRGYSRLIWHELPFDEEKVQQLPKWLRQYPDNYRWFIKVFAVIHRVLRTRNIN